MAEEDLHKTAITTPFGMFEYSRMPFGLRNTAQTFQRFMDGVCRGLEFAYVYLDDILVASESKEEHKHHLLLLFQTHKNQGLVVNREKFEFGQVELEFLGYKLTTEGTAPLPSRV